MLVPYEALDTTPPPRARRSPLSRSVFKVLVGALVCLLSTGPHLAAQEIDPQEVVRIRTDLITVPVVVTDSRDRRISGLRQGDFLIRTDGRPQRIDFFATGASRIALVFLLDASGSAREYLQDQRDTALSLFSHLGPQSEVAVVRFTDSATVAVPFSGDGSRARLGFDFPSVANARTAIFDAAMSALRLLQNRKNDPRERRIVILTSDGLDTASAVPARHVIESARQDGVSFYVIHFPVYSPRGGRLEPRSAAQGFRNLAEKTGGHYFVVGSARSALRPRGLNDLSPIFKEIERDLASEYLLGFYPDELARDGNLHGVKVKLTNKQLRHRVRTLRDDFSLKN